MKRFNVNFDLLIAQLLPPHKRQNNRTLLLQTLFNLSALFRRFLDWQNEQRRLIYVNAQVAILQGHLRRLFHRSIHLKTYDDGLIGISLIREGQLLPLGKNDEPPKVGFPLIGEQTQDFGDADFILYVPASVDMEALKREVEKFKLIDKKYKIIEI